MDEMTKQMVYALHDTYGYHEDEEDKAKEIINHLFESGISLARHADQDVWYRQGRRDERESAAMSNLR